METLTITASLNRKMPVKFSVLLLLLRIFPEKCLISGNGKKQAKKPAETVSKVTGYYLDMSDSFVGASADRTMIEKGIPSVTVECGREKNPLNLSQQTEISKKTAQSFSCDSVTL